MVRAGGNNTPSLVTQLVFPLLIMRNGMGLEWDRKGFVLMEWRLGSYRRPGNGPLEFRDWYRLDIPICLFLFY